MKILFACGGTGGHINPAIAIASTLKAKQPDAQILFAGNPKGMEAKLVPQAGFDFAPITIKGFQRKLTWFNIKYNISSLFYLTTASARSKKLIEGFGPDLVVGTGGYVSGPILRKAAQMGIRTASHESNAFPGVTTKLLSRYVDEILLAVPEAKKYLDPNCKELVVGNPVRESIVYADREQARKKLGVGDKMCIVSFGGSQGAHRLNQAMADLIAWHTKEGGPCTGKIHHIHATGKYGVEDFPQMLTERGAVFQENPNVDIREYINDMDDCLAAADLVICRAGASTVSELTALGVPAIMVPSPYVTNNHQEKNARALETHGGVEVLLEQDSSGQALFQTAAGILHDDVRREAMASAMAELGIRDAAQRIYETVQELL